MYFKMTCNITPNVTIYYFSVIDLTDIKKTMNQYYKLLEETKISLTKNQLPKTDAKLFSPEAFKQWVKSVDICNLDKEEAVNFAAAESIVTRFGDYRNRVGRELSQLFNYETINLPGELKNIGSCWDGSKVGKVNEVDSLYVMYDRPFIIKATESPEFYNAFIEVGSSQLEIKPRQLREAFADVYDQIIFDTELPNCLRHGGYNSSSPRRHREIPAQTGYSGIRYNGPAATSQFLTDEDLLTWDVSPSIELPDSKIQAELRETILPILEQNPRKQFSQMPVHLIPDPVENMWRVSTAHFDAELLRCLSDEAPVKKALMVCKIVCVRLKKWNKENGKSTECANQGTPVVNKLMRYLENNEQPKKQALEKLMRFAHIWLPCNKRAEYNENAKSSISINTAAVKHIIIKAGLQLEGAFAPKANEDLVMELVRVVFHTLSRDQDLHSDNAFLPGTRILHFSVLASIVSEKKVQLARSVCEQCRILLSKAMTEVGTVSVQPTLVVQH